MKIIKELSLKELGLSLLLLMYVGGFSYYWGAITNDLYLIVVFAFLVTHFIGDKIILHIICGNLYEYKIGNRYIRLILNFSVNYIIISILMYVVRIIHPDNLDEFLGGPTIFGILYGILYLGYTVTRLRHPVNEI